jgi:nitrite reductase/ring-hydroxylating ferredoxin subunit
VTFVEPVEQVGPGTPAGKILRQYWQPVAVSRDLDAGRARPLRILGEDLTLYRGESGTPHVVGARCAHRYTWLHTGWVEQDYIRCFYHGWMYDGTGQCVEQPAESDVFAEKIQIPGYPVREYGGLLFVYMGGDEVPPELPHYPELDDPNVTTIGGIRPPGPWPINYFQTIENHVDPVHIAFVHRASEPRWREVPEISARRTDFGIEMTAVRSGVLRTTRYHFPQMVQIPLFLIPGEETEFQFFNWAVPLDDDHTMFIATTAIPNELVDRVPKGMAGRLMAEDAAPDLMSGMRRPEGLTEEDYVAMVGQGRVADRTNERLGHSDIGVIQLRRLWREKLDALELRPPGTPDPERPAPRPAVQKEGVTPGS